MSGRNKKGDQALLRSCDAGLLRWGNSPGVPSHGDCGQMLKTETSKKQQKDIGNIFPLPKFTFRNINRLLQFFQIQLLFKESFFQLIVFFLCAGPTAIGFE